ncbi:MAG: hypothetical protein ACRDSJ_19715 [Rubrobacteraceae bacterium]
MEAFAGRKCINLETYRKNGEGARTPLWLAEEGGSLYVRTFEKTGKVKRLRRGSRARVAPREET